MNEITKDFRIQALRKSVILRTGKVKSIDENLCYASALELANLGFVVNPKDLKGLTLDDILVTIEAAREIIAGDRDMTPVYPGFPKQVQELPQHVLLFEQILHYMSHGQLVPDYPAIVRESLSVDEMLHDARFVDVANVEDFSVNLMKDFVNQKISQSDDAKRLLEEVVKFSRPGKDATRELLKTAQNGENIQVLIKALYDYQVLSENELLEITLDNLSNPDYILRAILVLYSLPVNSGYIKNYDNAVNNLHNSGVRSIKMKNIPRPLRRKIAVKLGQITKGYKADKLVAREEFWRKVMSCVHPYDFTLNEDEKRAQDIIHSNITYKTLNSEIESALKVLDIEKAITLMSEFQPGMLLRRAVSIMRLIKNNKDAEFLAENIFKVGARTQLTTLISAYNGILNVNNDHSRLVRVAGLNNTIVSRDKQKVEDYFVTVVLESLENAIVEKLKSTEAPTGPVGIASTENVPLVRRDLSSSDRVLERGTKMTIDGRGETLRLFSHWRNNKNTSGYMDIAGVVFDENFVSLTTVNWATANNRDDSVREIATYSGDTNLYPGHQVSEYVDFNMAKVKELFPNARYIAMTIESWSGWPIDTVDIVAGVMFRKNEYAGEVFDPRTVTTVFKPTTSALNAIPLVVDLKTLEMIWVDSSNGSTQCGVESSHDDSIGLVLYDELKAPRMSIGKLAELWAKAHNATTTMDESDTQQIMNILF